jgi:hypothetical protein
MGDNIKKVCEKYDTYIGFNFLNEMESLENISNNIKENIDKKLTIDTSLVDLYNKKLVSVNINGILDKFNVKNEQLRKAIIYGKTALYYNVHPSDGEMITGIITEIHSIVKK